MDGFGYTLTGGSAMHIAKMNAPARARLLQELFGTGTNDIGISYLRLSIGASDLSPETFTYNEMPTGQTDPDLKQFSIAKEMTDLVPVLKDIIAINVPKGSLRVIVSFGARVVERRQIKLIIKFLFVAITGRRSDIQTTAQTQETSFGRD